MLGKDLFKVQGIEDLNSDQMRSLISLYRPLVSNAGIIIYEELLVSPKNELDSINNLLIRLSMSLNEFVLAMEHLNEYRLINTYYHTKEEHYLFELRAPKGSREFIKDDLFGRLLLKEIKTERYQKLYQQINQNTSSLQAYEDQTKRLKIASLNEWSEQLEKDFRPIKNPNIKVESFFDTDRFVKEASATLFPLKFRTQENLQAIASLADLYNISQDRMRINLEKAIRPNSDVFDLNYLKYLCMNHKSEYQEVQKGSYDVPCLLFLMNLQEGKEVSPFDRRIIDSLANQYYLNPSVINYLLEYCLKNCEGRLYPNYIYPVASDLHRNNVKTVEEAKDLLQNKVKKEKTHPKDILPNYDQENKLQFDEKMMDEYFKTLKG